jgi:type II secretory pathway component PulM
MNRSLSSRERQLVAIAILLMLITLVYLGFLQPLIGGFAARSEARVQLVAQYANNDRLIGRIPSLVRAAQAQKQSASLFSLSAPNAEQAGEALKEKMSAHIEKAGAELGAVEALETRSGWVAAAAQARMTNAQLVQVLGKLQSEQPYLAFEALNISADRAVVSGKLDVMDVRIETSVPYSATNVR